MIVIKMRKFGSRASRKMRKHLNDIRNLAAMQIACDETKGQINKEKSISCNGMLFTFSVLITGNTFSSSSEFSSKSLEIIALRKLLSALSKQDAFS